MKIAIAGDCHVNKSTFGHVKDKENSSLPFRTVDFMKSMTFIVEESIKEKPNLFVFVGDTFDNFYPSPEIGGFFSSQLRKLRDNNIPVVILVGNHEVCKKHHALMPLKELDLDFAKVVDTPEMTVMGDYVLMFFPYSMEIEQEKITTKEQFNRFIEESKKKIRNDEKLKDKKVLFFGHFGVQGATLKQWTEKDEGLITEKMIKRVAKKNYKNQESDSISLEELDLIGAEYVFLGDYHKHQILPTDRCYAMYTGSIERTDIDEAGQKKGFIIYDSEMAADKKMGTCKFVEYNNCRQFLEIRGNVNEIKDAVRSLTQEYKEAIVRIRFVGDIDEQINFASELDYIKKQVKEKIQPVHIITDQELEVKSEEETSEKWDGKDFIEPEDILDIVKEIIDEREIENKHKKKISKLAEEIYNQAVAKENS